MENSWSDNDIYDKINRKKPRRRKGVAEMDYSEREREKERVREERRGEFRCIHCREFVSTRGPIGTEHRNHCPFCLWSKHVDLKKPGDRKSECKAPMEPIGLTFKQEGFDKYGRLRQGELMLIHRCTAGDKISINRIAGDDDPQVILEIFKASKELSPEDRAALEQQGIRPLDESDENQVMIQLFGKNYQDEQAH